MMQYLLLLTALLAAPLFPNLYVQAAGPVVPIDALQGPVLAACSGAWGMAPAGWSGGGDCSQAQGLTCDSNGMVVAIDLSNTPLDGRIPQEIGSLTTLTLLNLANCSLSGYIPISFSALTSLSLLDLSHNSLWGTTPSELGLLKNLRRLDLSGSSLHGSIPSGLGMLPKLRFMDLSSNYFNSSIPVSLGRLNTLTAL
ncbi:hypothetical protein CLOP_g15538 [Closterium sp. NIES-67]|nr:hypothetical protein CLOP_g15538 [Closterium sp. NIES-67]